MSQLYFYLFSHRQLSFCRARKITCMEIVCWLFVNGRESNTFPLTLSFPVVSLSHVHSCFEKEVFMLQLFDVGSCLRARGTSGLSKRSDAESRAWACRPASGEETVVLCSAHAQRRSFWIRRNLHAQGATELGWSQSFCVQLCGKVEEDPVAGCCSPPALLASTGVDRKGSEGACSSSSQH